MLSDHLKAAIPFDVMESADFRDMEDQLLITCPSAGENHGLLLLADGKLYMFAVPSSMGMWLEGNRLLVSINTPSFMNLRIFEPGQESRTLVSSKLGDIHDIRIIEDALYVVSTGTNEVAIVDMNGRICERFSMQGYGDSCHINCLDVWDGQLVASAFGNFTTYRGYKGRTNGAGIIFDLKSKDILLSGFSQPHNPRRDEKGAVYICDSRCESVLCLYEQDEKKILFPGAFTRGMVLTKEQIYVGLSSMRHGLDTAVSKNPITSAQLAVLDGKSLEIKKKVPLPVAEIYDILVLGN